ncbi:MAG: hypothetical protein ACRC6I_06785 [Paracoccaceae bacterium]
MRSFRLAGLMTLLSMTAACAQEPSCAFTGTTIFPELEGAEAAFLAGDYDRFVSLAGAAMPQLDGAALTAPLAEAVPDGFSTCSTILQREDVGGLVQELTVFTTGDGAGIVVLYMQSALIGEGRRILQFSFDSDLNKMLALLQ